MTLGGNLLAEQSNQACLQELAAALEYMPLALYQAGAYILGAKWELSQFHST